MTARDVQDPGVDALGRPPFLVELLRFVLVGIGYLSLLPALAWYLAYIRLGDQMQWMFLVNSGATYLFAPVPIVLLAALLTRRWGLAVAALVPLMRRCAGVRAVVGAEVVEGPAGRPSAPRLSVMTFNVHAHNDAPDALVASILAAGADIVALQGVDVRDGQRSTCGTVRRVPALLASRQPQDGRSRRVESISVATSRA